ncbi:hypothetical protein [Sporisorium scitamineum]|uniref:Uncharacterized protein n=1 Tax=Sporisorium scitamineum TaxID=49012 RepID=A0A0F7RTE9_9BASI|nr:hypothetical protein [Sporisorium scitamineum]
MTYLAWEAKNTTDAQSSTETSSKQLHLKLKFADLGTSTAFASTPCGMQPRLESIFGTDCP